MYSNEKIFPNGRLGRVSSLPVTSGRKLAKQVSKPKDLSISASCLATISFTLYLVLLSLVILVTWCSCRKYIYKAQSITYVLDACSPPTSALPHRQLASKSDPWFLLLLSFASRFLYQQRWACHLLSEMSSPLISRIHMREQSGWLVNGSW